MLSMCSFQSEQDQKLVYYLEFKSSPGFVKGIQLRDFPVSSKMIKLRCVTAHDTKDKCLGELKTPLR